MFKTKDFSHGNGKNRKVYRPRGQQWLCYHLIRRKLHFGGVWPIIVEGAGLSPLWEDDKLEWMIE